MTFLNQLRLTRNTSYVKCIARKGYPYYTRTTCTFSICSQQCKALNFSWTVRHIGTNGVKYTGGNGGVNNFASLPEKGNDAKIVHTTLVTHPLVKGIQMAYTDST